MSDTALLDQKYQSAAEAITMAGGMPLPINGTLLKLLRFYLNEDDLDFVIAFKGSKSQTMDQLKQRTGLSEEAILAKVKALAGRGVIFNQPNSAGVMVFRLLPLFNVGMFEYTFMGKVEHNDRNRQISALFHQLFAELNDMVQQNYDSLIPMLLQGPPVDRTVPVADNKPTGKKVTIRVDESVDASVERVVPTQEVSALIDKFDEIALGHCFCRHHKDIMGTPCKQTKERENCFTFGKSARYTTEQGFARMITKDEARRVLKKAEEDGLVHKAYHPNFDTSKDETSVCNCCRCCCGNGVDNMVAPIVNTTNYLAVIDKELCISCGTCVQRCHTGAAFLGNDGKSERHEEMCIGCGVCAHFCPANAISLKEGRRIVRIAPRRAKR
ncbi:MAG TPA: 4Fe-4S binding protein [Deltaproteobacteria bacterium]|nr:4Fe-4S binding protein [Deltaproteobacteria bacterium]HOI06361.1 4Fe-4S binding protein [Deltaproteobacteria bacterium]